MLRTSVPLIGTLGVKGKACVIPRAALILAAVTTAAFAQTNSPVADKRLPPEPFLGELRKEHCTNTLAEGRENIATNRFISGSLAHEGQTDWAVLCTTDAGHYIRIYWGGPIHCETRIKVEASPHKGATEAEYGVDRALGLADPHYINEHYQAYSGAKPPELDHMGINYIYVGKASAVFYCHQSKWLVLSGAD